MSFESMAKLNIKIEDPKTTINKLLDNRYRKKINDRMN